MKTIEFKTSDERHNYIYSKNLNYISRATQSELGKSYAEDFFELLKHVPINRRKYFKNLIENVGVKIDFENLTSSHVYIIFREGGYFTNRKTWEDTQAIYNVEIWLDEIGQQKASLYMYQEKLKAPRSYVVEDFYYKKQHIHLIV